MNGVRLVASMVVHNEGSRYLGPVVETLAGFCDRIVILDDGSTDNTAELLRSLTSAGLPITCVSAFDSTFYVNESETRQRALDLAMNENPTHMVVVDGDELVGGGAGVRAAIEKSPRVPAWSLCMEEVWQAEGEAIMVRQDGGWRAHPVVAAYRVDSHGRQLRQQKLGGGRVPEGVGRGAVMTDGRILHLGWSRVAERELRHARYVQHDGGNFHASAHLDSIMWPAERVKLERCDWPIDLPGSVVARVVAQAARD